MTALGKLYGVGVGPGSPELLTLRAVRVLESVDVIALPRSSDYGASVAWSILRDVVKRRDGQELLKLTFPMSKESADVRPRVMEAVSAIGERLRSGLSVAFATEGDPSLYSTFGYVRQEALKRWPELVVEVVPGVSSVMAVAGIAGIPLSDGQERIAIIPATYGVDDLVDLFNRFDTVVLMKLGGEIPVIAEALERTGLKDCAYFVSKATMEEQRFERDIRALEGERGGCFSMVIVKKTERSGLLMNKGAEAAS